MDRHKKVRYPICGRSMRSDVLKRHGKIHDTILGMSENEAREELKARHAAQVQRAEKIQRIEEIAHREGIPFPKEESVPDGDGELEEELLRGNQIYLDKIELGNKINDIMAKGVVREQSLAKEYKEALGLYRKTRARYDITSVELRPWQQDALNLIGNPSERQVIWINGKQGNEGKSWFQSYVESYFGFHRAARLDLRIKHASVCNVLKKRSLGSIDIFLFNDTRSVSGEELNLYRILEDIKDGQATASKYDNDNLLFKTPNTVMIFSNKYPQTKKLSRDRWVIYHPNQDGLKDVTEIILKMRKDGGDNENEEHLKRYGL